MAQDTQQSLANFIKYCLGYIKLTREHTFAAQQKYSVEIPNEYFGLIGLLNGDTDGSLAELINLDTFYKYDPKTVPKEEKKLYEQQKNLANKIEEIYNKHRNDEFTKQIILNFGYFEVELPDISDDTVDLEKNSELELPSVKTKIDRYPLFTLPVRIEKEITKAGVGKYFLHSVDPEIQVNVSMLEPILGEDLYFELLAEMGKLESEGNLSLPIVTEDIFNEVWHKIKAQLKLKDAEFDEKSFSLSEIKIALSPKANYFLAEDLAKLSKLSEEELSETSLTSWTNDNSLNVGSEVPHEKDLFFPFLYDKYQIATLSILGNKASIIQGPPGTGKSETISNILCHLAATGNRVLFVSQKAQALKVVKDKLNKLDIKYLYGYLPNPNSAQIGDEDEADGIAPQLTGLGAYIEKLGYNPKSSNGEASNENSHVSLERVVEEKENCQNTFNTLIDTERKIYELHQRLLSLADFDIEVINFESFFENFSNKEWHKIKSIKKEIERLGRLVENYERSSEKKEFDKVISPNIFEGKKYGISVGHIKNDIEKTGYDRHNSFFRSVNNTIRNFRVNNIRQSLPREIIDFIDRILAKDISKNQICSAISPLHVHCLYYENIECLRDAKRALEELLVASGISDTIFKEIDAKIDGSDFDEVKKQILSVYEIKNDLLKFVDDTNLGDVSSLLKQVENDRSKRISRYLQNIIDRNIIEKWKQGLVIRQLVQKLAKAFGKSKKAFKTFDNLRKDPSSFSSILELIPVWIMELDDASRIIPLQGGMFDYVILDEASQCNVAYTLPVMYRARKTLFVGDSEQMRDNTIMFKSNRVFDELAKRYQISDDKQIKTTGNAVQSVLDIAKNRGFMYRTLHYHYRSPAELINFSNEYFYKPNGKDLIPLNSNYLTYKDTNRVMIVHEVKSDFSEEISDNVNVAEAKAIVELFKELRADKKYRGKSIGILSFFNAQATFIRELFEKEGFKEDKDNYKVSIIEGIQGDEKDIVIYSFVIRTAEQKNRYAPLTGEGGDIRGDINKGRVNVAFSRARLQVHCFISMSPEKIPDKIWLKKYIEYVQENGEVSFYSTDLKPFDSYFEEDFFNTVRGKLKRGYKIQNQVESCGFKIDFVVSNSLSGKRIAVECDGPCHFRNEIDEAYGIHIQSDEERQRVLEAAGWKFFRIKYSDWINDGFNREECVKELAALLD